ncbi:Integral membrane protein OS=Streptomyces griseorubiginosus OX=67304 GN=AQJ54_30095 PE=4 SV=1 [Streptomyces griseorubiginosus]
MDPGAVGATRYADLYRTAMQIRFVALFGVFVAGALLLIRRMPPTRGRTPALLLALWAWGPVACTLAAHSLRALAARLPGARELPDPAPAGVGDLVERPGLGVRGAVDRCVTVLVARVTVKGEAPLPLAATAALRSVTASVGTAVVAVARRWWCCPTSRSRAGSRPRSAAGDCCPSPAICCGSGCCWAVGRARLTAPLGDWLLYRAADLLTLAVVWWSLRLLPGLLTRITVPAMAVGAVCAILLGLLASELLRTVADDTVTVWGPVHLFSGLGSNVPAALTFGVLAGTAAFVALRLTGGVGDVDSGNGGDGDGGDGNAAKSPEPQISARQSRQSRQSSAGMTRVTLPLGVASR